MILLTTLTTAQACDLCAVYRAADARGESGEGLVLGIAGQFIPYRTTQFEGAEVDNPPFREHVDSYLTHFLVGYNFSPRFGVNLNVPLAHLEFRRKDVRYSLTSPPVNYTEVGTETGLGDVSLIGRAAVFQKMDMDYGVVVNVLGGVKFPTGDDERVEEEIEQTKIFNQFVPPGTPHDPLGHSPSAVHQHMLALGSGSFDGIFGVTASFNWKRLFANAQFQYYLRTEADSGFKFGNETIVSGGPGVFVFLDKSFTLSVQAFAAYDDMQRDELLGTVSVRTGMTAWYIGPLVNLTVVGHFSANIGVDFPLKIENGFYQVVPNYRLHGGISWRF